MLYLLAFVAAVAIGEVQKCTCPKFQAEANMGDMMCQYGEQNCALARMDSSGGYNCGNGVQCVLDASCPCGPGRFQKGSKHGDAMCAFGTNCARLKDGKKCPGGIKKCFLNTQDSAGNAGASRGYFDNYSNHGCSSHCAKCNDGERDGKCLNVMNKWLCFTNAMKNNCDSRSVVDTSRGMFDGYSNNGCSNHCDKCRDGDKIGRCLNVMDRWLCFADSNMDQCDYRSVVDTSNGIVAVSQFNNKAVVGGALALAFVASAGVIWKASGRKTQNEYVEEI